MEWNIGKESDVNVVKCAGRFDVNIAGEFKKDIKELVAKGGSDLLVDLEGVTFIDSSGLGALVACLRAANQSGGNVRLCGLCPEVRITMELTRLHRVFEIFENKEEALAQ